VHSRIEERGSCGLEQQSGCRVHESSKTMIPGVVFFLTRRVAGCLLRHSCRGSTCRGMLNAGEVEELETDSFLGNLSVRTFGPERCADVSRRMFPARLGVAHQYFLCLCFPCVHTSIEMVHQPPTKHTGFLFPLLLMLLFHFSFFLIL